MAIKYFLFICCILIEICKGDNATGPAPVIPDGPPPSVPGCQDGKPCPPEAGAAKQDTNKTTSGSAHHRIKESVKVHRPVGPQHWHPFAAIFSYNYWKRRPSPLRSRYGNKNKTGARHFHSSSAGHGHDLFEGLKRVHYYHDHDFFTFGE